MIYIIKNDGGDRIGSLSAERDDLKAMLDQSGKGELFLTRGDEKTLFVKILPTPEVIGLTETLEIPDNSRVETDLRVYFGLAASTDVTAYVTSKLTKGGLPRKKPVEKSDS